MPTSMEHLEGETIRTSINGEVVEGILLGSTDKHFTLELFDSNQTHKTYLYEEVDQA